MDASTPFFTPMVRSCSIFVLLSALSLVRVSSALNAPSAGGAYPAGPKTVALHWVDNSTDETGFIVERYNGEGWDSLATVPAI